QLLFQVSQFGFPRQPAKPQEIASLLKRGFLGQFVNVKAAIGEHPGIAIDITNSGSSRYYAFKTFCKCAGRHDFPAADFSPALLLGKQTDAQHFFILQLSQTFQPPENHSNNSDEWCKMDESLIFTVRKILFFDQGNGLYGQNMSLLM